MGPVSLNPGQTIEVVVVNSEESSFVPIGEVAADGVVRFNSQAKTALAGSIVYRPEKP